MQSYCGGSPPFFLDELRVMRQPTLRTTVSVAAAVELERQRGGEIRKKKKEEGPVMPIYKEIGERIGAKIKGDQNDDYPAKWTPRFSESI